MHITVLGAGNLGMRVAALDPGARAVTATDSRHDALRAAGAEPTTEWPALATSDRVVLALSGSDAQREAVVRLAAGPIPKRVVLVSTTGYHHPYDGDVGPDSPAGDSDRARAAIRAEETFRAWAGHRGVIVRCGGLWHAERGPFAAFAAKKTAPLGPPDDVMPLVHYDDAATLVHAALTREDVPFVLEAVVSAPTRAEFYRAAAEALGCSPPAFADPSGRRATFVDADARRLLGTPAHADWRAMFGAA